jgi:uncharacterized repeat protein (TIGR01451 family)
MRSSKNSRGHRLVLLRSVAAGLLAFGASQAMALNVTLCAEPYTLDLPGAAGVPMWGYRQVTDASTCSSVSVARTTAATPVITVPADDTTLVITLVNALTVPTSIVLAGQDMPLDGGAPVHATDVTDAAGSTVCPGPSAADLSCRVRSFTGETAPGATRVYTFGSAARPLRPGTFLYQSGTHPQVQIQMGLAGILAKDAALATTAGRTLFTNPNWVFDADAPVLLSEVDDAMHTRIANTLGSATPGSWKAGNNSTFDYNPRFFLINGKPFDGSNATDLPVKTFNGGYVVLRMANAGLKSRSMVLNNGHWQVLTEDGNAYPAPREQYSLLLPAGKTSDAQIVVAVPPGATTATPDRSIALFDRRGGTDNADANPLGGQVARVALASGGTAPTNVADLAVSKSDGQTTVFVGDVITYTVTVSNAGPNAVIGAVVADAAPLGLSGVGWTCSATTGSACLATNGLGSINTTVDLANGGVATFLVSGTVAGPAGSLVNTASATVPVTMTDRRLGNNSATDVDTVLVRTADLSITKTRTAGPVVAGGTVQYTITVNNPAGSNSPVTAATVADLLPAASLSGAAWTCSATGGSACAASGTGSISTPVTLAIGGTATFTLNANVNVAATGNLANTATVAVPANVVDANLANNTASDTVAVVGFPGLTALDAFNRANAATLGANWSQATVNTSLGCALLGLGTTAPCAALRVNTNQAFAIAAGTAYWNVTPTGFAAKQGAAFSFANAPVNGSSLILKATGTLSALGVAPNFIRVNYTAGTVVISTTVPTGILNLPTTTVHATLNNANSTFALNDVMRAMVDATGTVYVWKNNSFVGSASLPNVALWTSGAGRIGMQLPTGARVDNFFGGTVTP